MYINLKEYNCVSAAIQTGTLVYGSFVSALHVYVLFYCCSHAAFRLANPLGCPMGWRRFGHPMAAAAMAMVSVSRYATIGTLVPPLDAVGLSD